MAVKSFVLLDSVEHVYQEPCLIGPEDVGGTARGYQIVWQRLRGGLSEGVDILVIDNGTFSFIVVPTRGMGLWRARRDDLTLGWQSPIAGPVHPMFVPVAEPSGLGWLDGFDELLVRCGLESNGAPEFDPETHRLRYPLHGRIANRPAHRVEVLIDGESGQIDVIGQVDESRFHFLNLRMTSRYRTKVGQPGVDVRDEIQNRGAGPGEFQMLYHVNFGAPLLDAGSRVAIPAKKLVPRNANAAKHVDQWDQYAGPQAGFEEQVYFASLHGDAQGRTRALLCNAQATRGASLVYDARQLPCFSLWKDTGALADGYVTGLEPGTNYPNPRSFEGKHGRAVRLAPGATATLDLTLEAHVTASEVEAAQRDVARLQAAPAEVLRQPTDDWCA